LPKFQLSEKGRRKIIRGKKSSPLQKNTLGGRNVTPKWYICHKSNENEEMCFLWFACYWKAKDSPLLLCFVSNKGL
jgi:hypothetical protein